MHGPERRAEIAGAGLGGLTAAAALARRGWRVTLHERGGAIRAAGSGIYMAENGMKVLDAVGAFAEATAGGHRVYRRETRDHRNRLIAVYEWPREIGQRVFILERARLMRALLNAAERAGASIRTGSEAVAVTPDGRLRLANGEERRADLVVAADGVSSRLRHSLGLRVRRKDLGSGAIRAYVPRALAGGEVGEGAYAEFWRGPRRVFYAPCSERNVYLALMTISSDRAAIGDPVDLGPWIASFPLLARTLRLIGETIPWAPFEQVRLDGWAVGRVALIGDAAHAMAPNLGQGGGCAMMDGLALAAALDRDPSVEAALRAWQARQKPLVDAVQQVSFLYGELSRWPEALRTPALWLMGRSKRVMRARMLAADHVPDGALPEPPAQPVERLTR